MIAKLEAFSELYRRRPIPDNEGGMRSQHMFLTWFALQELQPQAVIESGVWLGQGTWLIESACPNAQIYCIDLNLDQIQYKPKQATYFNQDFATIDWNHLPKEDTVIFFDDHQNAYERVKTAKWFGFKHLMFEDNYPAFQGDCYSLKKVLMQMGHGSAGTHNPIKSIVKQKVKEVVGIKEHTLTEIRPNEVDAAYLKQNLEIYYEFPPIYKTALTRWGDAWNDERYPTPEPLLQTVEKEYQAVYQAEATSYNWICYAKLR